MWAYKTGWIKGTKNSFKDSQEVRILNEKKNHITMYFIFGKKENHSLESNSVEEIGSIILLKSH